MLQRKITLSLNCQNKKDVPTNVQLFFRNFCRNRKSSVSITVWSLYNFQPSCPYPIVLREYKQPNNYVQKLIFSWITFLKWTRTHYLLRQRFLRVCSFHIFWRVCSFHNICACNQNSLFCMQLTFENVLLLLTQVLQISRATSEKCQSFAGSAKLK